MLRERAQGRRPSAEREVLAGVHPVREALRAGRRHIHRLLLLAGARRRPALEALLELARAKRVATQEVSAPEFERLAPAGTRTQGVLLEVGPLPRVPLEDLLGGPAPRWLVAVDGVEDPQNLGAVARVAEAAGVRGLLLPARRAAPLGATAARASAGALELLPVCIVVNLARSLGELKGQGFWVLGTDAAQGEDLFAAPERLFQGDLVLALGAEGRGLRPGVRSATDALLRIPLVGSVESLNVAAAAAVVLFEWRRRLAARS